MNTLQHKFYGLDHLRALAITFVFLFHYQVPIFGRPDWLPAFAKFGWTGVDLFFVLSGFLIASQLFEQVKENHKISLRDFFLKRFFRIIPAYLVVLAIYFFMPAFHEREVLPPAWKFLTFTHNFGLDVKNAGTFSHAWSLCVEEHFYLLLPFILLLLLSTGFFKRAYLILIVLFLLGFFLRYYSYSQLYLPKIEENGSWLYWYKYVYYPTYNRLDGLLTGVAIAGLFHFYPLAFSKISRFGNLLFCVSLLTLTGAWFLCEEQHSLDASVFGFPLVALGYGLMVIAAISPGSFLYRWKSKGTVFVAGLSYAIYLSHKGIINISQDIFAKLNVDPDSNLMLGICTVFSVLAALILNLLVEKPFMKLRTKILQKNN